MDVPVAFATIGRWRCKTAADLLRWREHGEHGNLFVMSTPCGQERFFHREWMFGEDTMRVMVTGD